jgi:hypothetical protein
MTSLERKAIIDSSFIFQNISYRGRSDSATMTAHDPRHLSAWSYNASHLISLGPSAAATLSFARC